MIQNNITHDKSISKFIIKLGLILPQLKYVCEFLYGAVGSGYNAKITHIIVRVYSLFSCGMKCL